jgi:hypothetical protein
MKRAIKFLRTALNDASAPSEAHKASIEFIRELKLCEKTIYAVEQALYGATESNVKTSDKTALEALKTSLQEQEKKKAAKSMVIKTGVYRNLSTLGLSSFDLFDIYENYKNPIEKQKAKTELDKRGLL